MRRLLLLLFLLSAFTIPVGCGGSPEEADTSHLESDDAKAKAESARAAYEKAGRGGPKTTPAKTN